MKQQNLEEQQWNIEMELRRLMSKSGKDWPQEPPLCVPALGCPSDLKALPRVVGALWVSPDCGCPLSGGMLLPVKSNPPLLCQGRQDVPLSVRIIKSGLLGQGGGRSHSGEVLPVAVRWASLVLCRGSEDTQGEGAREGAAGVVPKHSQ